METRECHAFLGHPVAALPPTRSNVHLNLEERGQKEEEE